MLTSSINGVKFPDEYVTRFFFKEGLQSATGRALELGCGNGNNLMLFYQHGWDVTGVDIDHAAAAQAIGNYSRCREEHDLPNAFAFHAEDMATFVGSPTDSPYDVLLLANSVEYLAHAELVRFFANLKSGAWVRAGSRIFVRTRSPRDYRFGRGQRLGPRTYRLSTPETGEEGCINTFLLESELLEILKANFDFRYTRVLHCEFDNYQADQIVSNSDIIVWGRLG